MLTQGNNYIYTVDSQKPGPTVVIMAGVHGNELPGIRAIDELMVEITPTQGKVIYVLGNPKAVEQNTRYIEVNLNRCFAQKEMVGYEAQRATRLKEVLEQADSLLDLHASNSPETTPFLICEPHSYAVAQKLPHINIISSGWDEVEPGGTDYYMNKINQKKGHGVSICAECGYAQDEGQKDVAKDIAITFLQETGVLEQEKAPAQKEVPKRYINVYHAHIVQKEFTPARKFKDFDTLSAGEVIGTDGELSLQAPVDSYILFATPNKTAGTEAYLLAKTDD